MIGDGRPPWISLVHRIHLRERAQQVPVGQAPKMVASNADAAADAGPCGAKGAWHTHQRRIARSGGDERAADGHHEIFVRGLHNGVDTANSPAGRHGDGHFNGRRRGAGTIQGERWRRSKFNCSA